MINHEAFVTELLKYASNVEDPEETIKEMLLYLGRELLADRAYIFEEVNGTHFDNTYEWCREGVTSEIDNLQGLPYEIGDVWYQEYDKNTNLIIEDIEEYKNVSRPMYDVLKPQGINTLITGPLELSGKYIGFFGVDNPPLENMGDISAIITLLSYIMSIMIRYRDTVDDIKRMSYEDQLTKVLNRQALSEYSKGIKKEEPMHLLVCDINGLKKMNDTKGHNAGDKLIKGCATSLAKVFGKDNVYRVGGDEFVVWMQDLSEDDFKKKIEKVREVMDARDVSASIGHVSYPRSKHSIDRMMKDADVKMYEDKKNYYLTHGTDRRKRRDD